MLGTMNAELGCVLGAAEGFGQLGNAQFLPSDQAEQVLLPSWQARERLPSAVDTFAFEKLSRLRRSLEAQSNT